MSRISRNEVVFTNNLTDEQAMALIDAVTRRAQEQGISTHECVRRWMCGDSFANGTSKVVALLAVALLTGCATMERHPVATWVTTAVLVGSIAASAHHDTPQAPGADLCRAPLSCK